MDHLPVETIEQIFDNVTSADIVRTSAVSRQWRSISQNHPLFWKDVELRSVSDAAIEVFATRLRQRPERTICIRVHLDGPGFSDRFATPVLPVIVASLFRVEFLTFSVHRDAMDALYSGLSLHAAHALTMLAIHFSGHPLVDALPITLFSGQASRLKYVSLKGIMLPSSGVWPPSFNNVQELTVSLDLGRQRTAVLDFACFATLSSLASLRIHGGTVSIDELYSESSWNFLFRIRALSLISIEVPPEFWSWAPVARLVAIGITDKNPETIINVAQHLHGHLHATMTRKSSNLAYMITLVTLQTLFPFRIFQGVARPDEPFLHPVWWNSHITDRIVKMTIHLPMDHLHNLRCMACLSNCTVLELILDDGMLINAPEINPQILPRVSCIIIKGLSPTVQTIPAEDVRNFLQAWVSVPSQVKSMSLMIDRIQIGGAVDGLPPVVVV